LLQWQELYEGRKIEEVELETFCGQSTRVKVKPIKDSKFEGKGIVQMPEKIQNALEIRKGELIRVKPVIE
jgi:aspartate carbamoyltransferase regulatory subunit